MKSPHLLIVDPRASVRQQIRQWIRTSVPSARVTEAETLREALPVTDESATDCILVGTGVDGVESASCATDPPVVLVLDDSHSKVGESVEPAGIIVLERLGHPETALAVRNAIENGRLRRKLGQRERAGDEIDPTTELPSRTTFGLRLSRALESRAQDELAGLLLVGLDGFKAINRDHGHRRGDDLLRQIANRLKHCVRAADTIARWNGDEFAILLDGTARAEDVRIVAQRITYSLSRPFDDDLHVAASVGIAISPADGDETDTLVRNAEAAMYRVKRAGGNDLEFYSPGLDAGEPAARVTESRLRAALRREEFFLVYQPQIDTVRGDVVGLEALLRWDDPETGIIPPIEFVPLLEETGLIVPVGDWVLRKACTQARAWELGGLPGLRVSVNLSAVQFRQRNLVGRIRAILEKTGVKPGSLELEVTESVLMEDPACAAQVLAELKELGASVALDDFGTGHSSLGALKSFPVDTLKIDRAFIEDIESSEDDRSICSAVIALGRALHLRVLAEGVETQAQSVLLEQQGCHLIQGFLYARPMSSDDVWTWLTEGEHTPAVERSAS